MFKLFELLKDNLSKLQANFKIVNMFSDLMLSTFAKIVETDFDPSSKNLKLKKQVAFEYEKLESALSIDRKENIDQHIIVEKALSGGGKFSKEKLKELEAKPPLSWKENFLRKFKEGSHILLLRFRD